ncbi:11632_t:CDS:2, partial [Cetraspora pellucida]
TNSSYSVGSKPQKADIPDASVGQSRDVIIRKRVIKTGGSLLRSPAWKWFEEVYIDNIRHGICNIELTGGKPCDTKVKTGELTTALWRHLKNVHGYSENRRQQQTTIKRAFEISSSKLHNTTEQTICDKAITEQRKVKSLIDEGFNQISFSLRHDLYKAETVSLTVDLWTACSHKGYLGIMATWINEKFELNEAVLAVTSLHYSYTGDAIAKYIEDIFEH